MSTLGPEHLKLLTKISETKLEVESVLLQKGLSVKREVAVSMLKIHQGFYVTHFLSACEMFVTFVASAGYGSKDRGG